MGYAIRSIKSALPLATGLRAVLAEGYTRAKLLADVQAGLIVGLVALPLGMALAIASGASPREGLVTVVVAGSIAAVLGGSRFQVTGPTAAFVALLVPVVARFGLGGLLVAGFLAGAIQVAMGLSGLGRAITFVPHPVTTGFTSGIALVIASIQLKDFLGLRFSAAPEHFLERLGEVFRALPSLSPAEAACGLLTLALIAGFGRLIQRIPSPLLALVTMSAAVFVIQLYWPALSVETIGTRFHYEEAGALMQGIPRGFPAPDWPWARAAGGQAAFTLSFASLRAILPSAFAIALLGALESLLSASVADGMSRRRHDPDAELLGQGLANLVCPFFGGIPATGAIARTATAIRFGAVSPVASLVHAATVLLVLLFAAPLAAYLPMASLAALLMVVAWNMSERHHFAGVLKVGRWGDRLVLLTCFGLTVFFDMTIGVTAGMMLAAFFLIKRVGEMGQVKALAAGEDHPLARHVPKDTLVYEISGPLLFGAAQQAMEALGNLHLNAKRVVFDLRAAKTMDITGLVALETAVKDARRGGQEALVVASAAPVLDLLSRSPFFGDPANGPPVYGSVEAALQALGRRARRRGRQAGR